MPGLREKLKMSEKLRKKREQIEPEPQGLLKDMR